MQVFQKLRCYCRFLGFVNGGRFIGNGFKACGDFTGQSFAFLVIRQNAAEQKAHQKDVCRHDAGEERIQRNRFPAQPVYAKLDSAYDQHRDCRIEQQQSRFSQNSVHLFYPIRDLL